MAQKKEGKEEQMFLPSKYTVYPKSNVLISSKYKSTLLENKIMAYSLSHTDQFDFGSSDRETIRSSMNVTELRKAIGGNRGSFYQALSATAEAMTGRSIGMSSVDGKTFDYIAVVTRATCKDGVFTIEYNPAIRMLLTDLRRDYSRLNLAIQLRFKSNHSFRLYELLKQTAYHAKGYTGDPDVFHARYGLAELKLDLGIVNAELDAVRRVLKGKKNPDYEKAVETSPERMFDKWSEFKRGVLDKAIREINETSDIHVDYSLVRKGTGGKVAAIDFTIRMDRDRAGDVLGAARAGRAEMTEDERYDFLVDAGVLTEKAFHAKDLRAIADAAGWDLGKIGRAYRLLLTQKDVANPAGWMVRAVKEGYEAPAEAAGPAKKKKAGKRSKPGFTDFEQRDYDFDDLERRLSRSWAEDD